MATRVMVVWILALQVMWAGVFIFFNRHFDGTQFEERRVALLEQKLHKNQRLVARLQLNFDEYKDSMVAAGIKIDDKTSWTDEKRMIASVMADPQFKTSPLPEPGNTNFKAATQIYSSGDYHRASVLLQEFVEKYPDHPQLPEAYYLLSESYFYTSQYEQSVKSVDFLITHFPETEFAGYGLLRLGKIFEKQERPDEAAEMYQSLMSHYPKSNAAFMASKSLKALDL